MLSRYIKDEFINTTTTVGIEFAQKLIVYDNTVLNVNIMDTAGQERYKSMSPIFFRNAIGALLVFDVTDKSSFNDLPSWIEKLREHTDEGIVTILIGNKVDLDDKRVVDY